MSRTVDSLTRLFYGNKFQLYKSVYTIYHSTQSFRVKITYVSIFTFQRGTFTSSLLNTLFSNNFGHNLTTLILGTMSSQHESIASRCFWFILSKIKKFPLLLRRWTFISVCFTWRGVAWRRYIHTYILLGHIYQFNNYFRVLTHSSVILKNLDEKKDTRKQIRCASEKNRPMSCDWR